jgi:two-component system, NarL family, response regulator YdfI
VIRIFVAADARRSRDALQAAVESAHDLELAGAASIDEALGRFGSAEPFVAIVDAPELETAYQVIETRVPMVVLADAPREEIFELLRAGANAVLPRDTDPSVAVAAARAAAVGLVAVLREAAPALASAESARSWRVDEDRSPHLSPREREVLRLLAAGTGNKGIALRLTISEHTVKFHVASILAKLHASSRTEAVTEGIRRGLVML